MTKLEELINLLKEKKLTLGSVESLTGGLFASSICSVPGVSRVFKGSIVTYQYKLKESLLGIDHSIIAKNGVVSDIVAKLMCEKGIKLLDCDIVISFTGNAGPTKDIGDADVGLVYSALLCKKEPTKIEVKRKNFNGERNAIRTKVVEDSYDDLINFILSNY